MYIYTLLKMPFAVQKWELTRLEREWVEYCVRYDRVTQNKAMGEIVTKETK